MLMVVACQTFAVRLSPINLLKQQLPSESMILQEVNVSSAMLWLIGPVLLLAARPAAPFRDVKWQSTRSLPSVRQKGFPHWDYRLGLANPRERRREREREASEFLSFRKRIPGR